MIGASIRSLLTVVVLGVLVAGFVDASAASLPVSSSQLSSGSVRSCTLGPSADASVDEAAPAATNGTGAQLAIDPAVSARKRSWVKFDIASCGIPASATVKRADLDMVLAAAPSTSRTWELRPALAAWGETISWNDQPGAGAVTTTASTGTTAGTALRWSAVGDVQQVVSAGSAAHGWQVRDAGEGALLPDPGALASREAAVAGERPVLTITWYEGA